MKQINESIKQKVQELAKDGRLTCAEAIAMANREGVPQMRLK